VSLNRRNVTLHLCLNQLFPADTESPSKGFRLRPKKLDGPGEPWPFPQWMSSENGGGHVQEQSTR
jgi:hypothetical protein